MKYFKMEEFECRCCGKVRFTENIEALVEKLTGKSEFKGEANDLVWCDRWDTRL